MARPEEELSVRINYNVSGRTVNYVFAAFLGIGGYGIYSIDGSSQEVRRLSEQPVIIEMQADIKSLKVSSEVITTFMTKINSAKISEVSD